MYGGKAGVPSGFLVLGMKSCKDELPMAPCCMLGEIPLWNAGTGFAKMGVGTSTPSESPQTHC